MFKIFRKTNIGEGEGAPLNPKRRGAPSLWSKGYIKTKKIITIAVILVLIATSIIVLPLLTQASWFGAGKAGVLK